MRYRNALSYFFTMAVGAAIGAAIKIGYVLPGVLPTTDLFMYIVTSPLGIMALKATSGKAGFMIAIVIRAFTCSILAGAIAGIVLHKIKYQRVFCYSALWLPLSNFVSGYLLISNTSVSNPEHVAAIQAKFGEILWVNLWVYGWYFLALYISYVVFKHFTHNTMFQPA